MICPYNHMKIEQVTQDRYEYNTDGMVTLHENKLIESRKYGDCLQANCGAYRNGKCVYNLTQLTLEDMFDNLLGCEEDSEEIE